MIEGLETINAPLVTVDTNNHQVGTIAEMREIDATREVAQTQVANPDRMTMVAVTTMGIEEERGVTMVVKAAAITETTTEISVVIVTVGTTTEKSRIKSDMSFSSKL